MNTELASTAIAMRTAATQHSATILMLRKAHEMKQQVVEMVAQAADAPPPPPKGQGANFDRTA